MKKIFAVLVLALLTIAANAQNWETRTEGNAEESGVLYVYATNLDTGETLDIMIIDHFDQGVVSGTHGNVTYRNEEGIMDGGTVTYYWLTVSGFGAFGRISVYAHGQVIELTV